MMRGRGGECANRSFTGVPGAQTRERRRWDADSRMRDAFVQDHRPAERKHVKKGIIVEDVDRCARLSVVSRPCLTKKLIRHRE